MFERAGTPAQKLQLNIDGKKILPPVRTPRQFFPFRNITELVIKGEKLFNPLKGEHFHEVKFELIWLTYRSISSSHYCQTAEASRQWYSREQAGTSKHEKTLQTHKDLSKSNQTAKHFSKYRRHTLLEWHCQLRQEASLNPTIN